MRASSLSCLIAAAAVVAIAACSQQELAPTAQPPASYPIGGTYDFRAISDTFGYGVSCPGPGYDFHCENTDLDTSGTLVGTIVIDTEPVVYRYTIKAGSTVVRVDSSLHFSGLTGMLGARVCTIPDATLGCQTITNLAPQTFHGTLDTDSGFPTNAHVAIQLASDSGNGLGGSDVIYLTGNYQGDSLVGRASWFLGDGRAVPPSYAGTFLAIRHP